MGFFGVKNLFAKICFLTLSAACFYVGAEETTNLPSGNNEEEAEDAGEIYMNQLQDDYQTGLVTMVEFLGSLSSSLKSIEGKLNSPQKGEQISEIIRTSVNGPLQEINQRLIVLERSGAQKHQEFYDKINQKFIALERAGVQQRKELYDKIESKLNALNLATMSAMKEHLEKLRQSLEELKRIEASRGSVVVPSQGITAPRITSSCGGFLEVVENSESTIRYPNAGNYTSKERCVWTLVPKKNFASYNIKVDSASMEANYDGVTAFYWDSRVDLQSQKITTFGSWISIPAPYVIITFCSDESRVGSGFRASILGVGSSSDSAIYRPFWLENPKITFTYPGITGSFGSNEVVAVVIQPEKGKSLKVSVSSSNTGTDVIKIYNLRCEHSSVFNYELVGSGSGFNPSGIPGLKSSSEFPRLVIFKKERGSGFTLSFQ